MTTPMNTPIKAPIKAAMSMRLAQVQSWLPQAVLINSSALSETAQLALIQAVCTDSRQVKAGDLFVALKGDNFDGTVFLAQAESKGAVAVLFEAQEGEQNLLASNLSVPALCVPNAREALGLLAAAWRRQFILSLIGVTGSNGKTTVTQMIASILRADALKPSLSTQGNLNNDIGVPLTLFNLRAQHQRAVVELGMNHPGEIEVLARWAQPTIGLVNNAQREHQEHMASVEAVAQENAEVIRALPEHGVAVFPAQDAYTPLWQSLAGQRQVITFGFEQGDVQAHDLAWVNGQWQFNLVVGSSSQACQLAIAGRHNVLNALAATACALASGMSLSDIVQGLENFEPVKGRSKSWQWQIKGHAFTLIDDTYNANPDSVRAAIDVLAELPGPRLLVLGDMGEVGQQGPAFHAEVGAYAQSCGIQHLYTVGALSIHASEAFQGAQHFEDVAVLQPTLLAQVGSFQSVLIKGSRFMKMERLVEALRECTETSEVQQERESVHAA